MKANYPIHLYDPIRREVVNSYIKRELRRLLPSTDPLKLDNEIDKWFERLLFRDYWNGVHGIAMGFRLKHHFIHVISAENIKWEKKIYPLDESIVTGVDLGSIVNGVPNERISANNIDVLIHRYKSRFDKWHREYSKNVLPNTGAGKFPIIAVQEKFPSSRHSNDQHDGYSLGLESKSKFRDVYSIHDGNNRFVEAIYLGKKKISAYLGTFTTKEFVPKNFWLPTSFLMDLVYNAKLVNDPEDLTKLLKKLTTLSESGEYELMERVLIGKSEFRNKVKRDLK